MKISVPTLVAAVCLWFLSAPARVAGAPGAVAGEYRIAESFRDNGAVANRGKVTIEAPGPAAFDVRWNLEGGETFHGPAILQNGVLGVGYGDGLTGLAVYEIKGGTLRAKWLLPTTPQTVGEYELNGPPGLNGFYKLSNGLAGGLTIKPNGKVYTVLWSLPTGSFSGIAVRLGDVLVAASGTAGTNFGVAAYRPVGNRAEGVWTVSGRSGLGTEVLVPASTPAPAETAAVAKGGGSSGAGAASFSATGAEVRFAGDTFQLKSSQSAPGKSTSELREYLRAGETFEQYPKMVALRVQESSGADPLTFTRAVLRTVKKDYPTAETSEIAHTDDSATMEFLLVNGADAEYNFWHYFRLPQGRLGSVQFVLRNKAPYETKDKFKAERAAHFDDWVRDARTLALQVPAALAKTAQPAAAAGKPPETPPKPEKKSDTSDNEALAAKLSVDLRAAAGIAGNFLGALQAGKLNEAAALVADEGLTQMRTTRADFLAKLQGAQQKDGRVLSFTPDKSKTDFGAEAGGIYFVLVADSKCEKTAAVRETLRFFRGPDGQIKMVGYQRTPAGAAAR